MGAAVWLRTATLAVLRLLANPSLLGVLALWRSYMCYFYCHVAQVAGLRSLCPVQDI